MKLRTWTLAIALAAGLAAATAHGASTVARAGVRVYVETGPICKPGVCTRIYFTGWNVTLLRNGVVVARGRSKGKQGLVLYGTPGGGYSVAFTGTWKGRKIAHQLNHLPPLTPGVVYPAYLEIN